MSRVNNHKAFVIGFVFVLAGIGGLLVSTHVRPDAPRPIAKGPSAEELLRGNAQGHVAGDSIYASPLPGFVGTDQPADQPGSPVTAPVVVKTVAVTTTPSLVLQQPAVQTPEPQVPSQPSTPTPTPVEPTPPAVPVGPTPINDGTGGIPVGFSIIASVQSVSIAPGETSAVVTYATSDGSVVIWSPFYKNVIWGDGTNDSPLADHWMTLDYPVGPIIGSSVSFRIKAAPAALTSAALEVAMSFEDGTRNMFAVASTKLSIVPPTVTLPVPLLLSLTL